MGICHSKAPVPANGSQEQNKPVDMPSNEPKTFKSQYQLLDEIGHGAFSSVKLGQHKMTGEKYAVKCVTRKDLPKEDEVSLREEVAILRKVKHQNIIQLFDFFEEPDMFYLVTELMEGGELFDRIVQKTFYNEKEARDLVMILLDAIFYCHEQGIVHRDLKPENLLLKSKEDDSTIKIADFGFAKEISEHAGLSTQCGTPGYVAPEILEGKEYGTEVDMWSIGVITYILLGGYPPFYDEKQANLYRKIKKGEYEFDPEYWDAVSSDAKDLISKMLVVNPAKRLTAAQALRHPWFLGSEHDLVSRNLERNLKELRKYNARRKLRAAAHAVMWANSMSRAFAHPAKPRETGVGGESKIEEGA